MEKLEESEKWEQVNSIPVVPIEEDDNKLEILNLPKLKNLQLIHDDCSGVIYEQLMSSPELQSFHRVDQISIKHIIKTISTGFLTSDPSDTVRVEDNLIISHFLSKQNYQDLCKYLFVVYKYSNLRYSTILGTILAQASDITIASEIIRQLPVLSDQVWSYLNTCTDRIDILLPLLKGLLLSCNDKQKILDIIFNLVKVSELYQEVSQVITQELYTNHSVEIERMVVEEFSEAALEKNFTSDCEPKIKLFFKLSRSNSVLLDHFVKLYPDIHNHNIREFILNDFLRSLRKNPDVSDFLLENLKTNAQFSRDCVKIFGNLTSVDPKIKEIFLNKAIEENDLVFLTPILPHVDVEDLSPVLDLILQQRDKTVESISKMVVEGNISVSQLLFQLNLKLGIREKDLISDVIRLANRSTDVEEFMHSLSSMDQIPQLGIFSILKCNEKFSNLKQMLVADIFPVFIEREIWTQGKTKEGFLLLVLKTLPNSLELETRLPGDLISLLEKRQEYRKERIKYQDSLNA